MMHNIGIHVPGDQELPPLNELLEYISYDIKWSPKDSIFKLFIMFCLPKMVTSACVKRAEHQHVQDLIFHYAEEGKLIELAALLCFLPHDFLYRFKPNYIGFLYSDEKSSPLYLQKKMEWVGVIETLRERIATKIVSLIVEEQKLLGSRSSNLAEKKRLMMSVMLLLEIYGRDGDDLIGYCLTEANNIIPAGNESMAICLMDMLMELGYPVTNELCEVYKHNNCSCEVERRILQLQFSGGAPINVYSAMATKRRPLPITKMQRLMMPVEQQRRSFSTHSSPEQAGLFSMVQSIYISQKFKTMCSPKFRAATEAPTRQTFQVIKPHMLRLVLGKKFSSFLSVMKRGI